MGLDAKGVGWIVAGLIVIGISYYVGFVGWTETKMMAGDQGYGLYEVTTTYPIAGVVGIIAGIGIMGNALDDGSPPTEERRQSPTKITEEGEEDGVQDDGPDADESAVVDDTGDGDVENDGDAATGAEFFCPRCGESTDPSLDFCTSCGDRIPADVT